MPSPPQVMSDGGLGPWLDCTPVAQLAKCVRPGADSEQPMPPAVGSTRAKRRHPATICVQGFLPALRARATMRAFHGGASMPVTRHPRNRSSRGPTRRSGVRRRQIRRYGWIPDLPDRARLHLRGAARQARPAACVDGSARGVPAGVRPGRARQLHRATRSPPRSSSIR